LRITCPDQTSFAATSSAPTGWGAVLGSCLGQGPALDYGGGGTGFDAELSGGLMTESLEVFSCE
jgi:hypothetical protein